MSTRLPMFAKAITIATIFSLVGTIIFTLLFGESTHYKNGMVPSEYYSLGYDEQIAWREENEVTITGIKFVQEALAEPYLRNQILENLITWFFISFFSSLLMALWLKKSNDS